MTRDEPGLTFRPSHVSENMEIASGVYLLKVPRETDFSPGQIVALKLDARIEPRYYSIASGADESFLDLLYDVVPAGALTPRLSLLQTGDPLQVSDPFGSFLDRPGETWWIATGTGIAPFVSMAKSASTEGKHLIHGGRTPDRFYYRQYFARSLGERYTCCCSQGSPPWAYPGRLTAWLEERDDLPADARYMLCGGSAMVVEVRDILIGKGVPFENIASEIYF